MLKEMIYRELRIAEGSCASPFKNAAFMYFSYIVGGLVPLFAYFVLDVPRAMPISIIITLTGLFTLGVAATKYTKKPWMKSGTRILALGAIALVVGFVVGQIVAIFN
jgi:vacuolar iron transporter family protein